MNIKDIAHLWELGMSEASFTYLICVGGSAVDMKELMLVPVNEGNLHTSVIVLAFDLTAVR
jgi:hypothetical protein